MILLGSASFGHLPAQRIVRAGKRAAAA